jgi:hypothetical protein
MKEIRIVDILSFLGIIIVMVFLGIFSGRTISRKTVQPITRKIYVHNNIGWLNCERGDTIYFKVKTHEDALTLDIIAFSGNKKHNFSFVASSVPPNIN